MKARLLRAIALDDLRNSIAIAHNLDRYRNGNFEYLEADPAFTFEHDVEIAISALADLHAPGGGNSYEVENCAVMYRALSNLSPYDARDERLWGYLSHTVLLEHARRRWVIPNE